MVWQFCICSVFWDSMSGTIIIPLLGTVWERINLWRIVSTYHFLKMRIYSNFLLNSQKLTRVVPLNNHADKSYRRCATDHQCLQNHWFQHQDNIESHTEGDSGCTNDFKIHILPVLYSLRHNLFLVSMFHLERKVRVGALFRRGEVISQQIKTKITKALCTCDFCMWVPYCSHGIPNDKCLHYGNMFNAILGIK